VSLADNLAVLAAALLIEGAAGYPDRLFRAIRHPVVWIGALIGWCDRTLNRERDPDRLRRRRGVGTLLAVLLAAVVCAWLVERAGGRIVAALAAASLLAQRSLWTHVAAVAGALEGDGLAGGRAAVSRIVGRNPASLDEAGVARAALESLAENFSDGGVAPALWCALFGLPGIAAYKAVNTADSMIGHRTARHAAFGWAAARLDDLLNLVPARLAALYLVAAATPSGNAAAAWRALRRDARRHRSPNAGYPEAAMAGALGLSLAGPRIYGGTRVEDAFMSEGRREADAADIRRALALYRRADAILLALLGILAVAFTAPI
jgi:adenosylcobinamide-phosphate synthase